MIYFVGVWHIIITSQLVKWPTLHLVFTRMLITFSDGRYSTFRTSLYRENVPRCFVVAVLEPRRCDASQRISMIPGYITMSPI